MKKIAIPTDNNVSISEHFGKAKWFKIIEIEENHVGSFRYVENLKNGNGETHKHEAIVDALKECEIVIARDMGKKMQEELQSMNKKIVFTSELQMDLAVEAYLSGNGKSN